MDGTLLRDIAARPRPTGGAALAAARRRCETELRAMGFTVREVPFEFSGFPGRFGTPLLGASVMGMVAVAGHSGARGAIVLPLSVLIAGALVAAAVGRWLARDGILRLPLMRERGITLEASRAGVVPMAWLCAHLDSKSQPVPTLVRTIGFTLLVAGFLVTLALSIAAALGVRPPFHVWSGTALVTLAGAIPVVLSMVGAKSPGAFDNASGVATVLEAARQLGDVGVGVLITDAEELGLAGARAWCAAEHEGSRAVVLNCDGVDDGGVVTVMFSGERPTALLGAVVRASATTSIAHRARRLPVGVLTDSIAFADAGHPSVTFSRGSWASLARVHSVRDDLSRLRGDGIEPTAALMAATVREMVRT